MANQPLTWFERPPVVETVLGVQFEPIRGLTSAHLGAFWAQLGPGWPKVQDAPRLEPQFEDFGEEHSWTQFGARLTLTQVPSIRLQIRNQSEDRMIQVQNDRFHYNWLDEPGTQYPRYEKNIRPEFFVEWDRFLTFVNSLQPAPPKLTQWEVTYVNHIPQKALWNKPADWAELIPGLLGHPPKSEVARFESVGGQWHFEIPPQRGRLHVQVIHGKRSSPDSLEIVRIDLTARGPVTDNEDAARALSAGLDLGREAIVRMFVALTPKKAHEYWGIHNA